ncbi:unnamed protein product [Colias eurytheme]|nr:unnamed protein product [Colias eurytheme]
MSNIIRGVHRAPTASFELRRRYAEDNQYSVTSLSRIHCRSAVLRTPKSPLPVRYRAACCLTQFSSARGVKGVGGGQSSAQLHPQVCNSNEALRDSNPSLQY